MTFNNRSYARNLPRRMSFVSDFSSFHATMVTFQVTPCVKIVENHHGKGLYTRLELKAMPASA